MALIEEVIKGTKPYAFCLTVIGDQFQKKFKKISLPHFLEYCKKYGIGLLILKNYIDKGKKSIYPYSKPNTQRLLIPEIVESDFRRYKYICDIDVDVIPGPLARDIFSFPSEGDLLDDHIYLTYPSPANITLPELGRRISLLRKNFYDKTFPLDSILTGSDEFTKKTFGLKFSGPFATIGTCLGPTKLISSCFRRTYDTLAENFNGYLQHFTNQFFRDEGEIYWLPYEFQAIWSYEVALYYPFLYSNEMKDLAYECITSTLLRVDMLHFAGSWPENLLFDKGPFIDPGYLGEYFERLPSLLKEEYTPKSYGKILPSHMEN